MGKRTCERGQKATNVRHAIGYSHQDSGVIRSHVNVINLINENVGGVVHNSFNIWNWIVLTKWPEETAPLKPLANVIWEWGKRREKPNNLPSLIVTGLPRNMFVLPEWHLQSDRILWARLLPAPKPERRILKDSFAVLKVVSPNLS